MTLTRARSRARTGAWPGVFGGRHVIVCMRACMRAEREILVYIRDATDWLAGRAHFNTIQELSTRTHTRISSV